MPAVLWSGPGPAGPDRAEILGAEIIGGSAPALTGGTRHLSGRVTIAQLMKHRGDSRIERPSPLLDSVLDSHLVDSHLAQLATR